MKWGGVEGAGVSYCLGATCVTQRPSCPSVGHSPIGLQCLNVA